MQSRLRQQIQATRRSAAAPSIRPRPRPARRTRPHPPTPVDRLRPQTVPVLRARRRRPNAARSTRRSTACAPISTNCRRAPAAAAGDWSALIAQASTPSARPGALFGGQPLRRHVPAPSGPMTSRRSRCRPTSRSSQHAKRRAGSHAVCVRSCDGSFFPVSYSASGGRSPSSRTCAARSAPTPTFPSTLSRLGGQSNRRCRAAASAIWTAPMR